MITVVFADDHPLTREGIRSALSKAADIQIVGEAENGDQVQPLVEELRPQILLLDLKMPGRPSAEIERWVRAHYPETATLILTAHDRDAYLVEMMDAGAVGLLDKEASAERLIGAIRRAASGETLFDAGQYQRAERWRKAAGEKWDSLTEREKQITQLLVAGADKERINLKLEIAVRTVDYHLANLFKKLEVKSQKEVLDWAHKYLSDDQVKLRG
jgi:DNA-binding NarL/FixJ family response regulator